MRLITGRTARPSSGISTICERCSHHSLLSGSVAHVKENAVALSVTLTPEEIQTLDAEHPPAHR